MPVVPWNMLWLWYFIISIFGLPLTKRKSSNSNSLPGKGEKERQRIERMAGWGWKNEKGSSSCHLCLLLFFTPFCYFLEDWSHMSIWTHSQFQDMLFCLFALLPFFFYIFKYWTKLSKIKGGYMYIIFQGPIIQIMISMN